MAEFFPLVLEPIKLNLMSLPPITSEIINPSPMLLSTYADDFIGPFRPVYFIIQNGELRFRLSPQRYPRHEVQKFLMVFDAVYTLSTVKLDGIPTFTKLFKA